MNRISQLWNKLNDEEIACYETMRDVFFIAVKKKYGIPRAQAEDILRYADGQFCPEAA